MGSPRETARRKAELFSRLKSVAPNFEADIKSKKLASRDYGHGVRGVPLDQLVKVYLASAGELAGIALSASSSADK
jgi:hypothetical protein